MMKRQQKRHIFSVILLVMVGLLVVGCAEDAEESDPADSVEKYLKAMTEHKLDDFNAVICEDFQATARVEYDGLGSVETSLRDMKCTASDKNNDSANVTCTGFIEVVYDGENTRDLALEGYTYRMVNDDDEWKVCGKE